MVQKVKKNLIKEGGPVFFFRIPAYEKENSGYLLYKYIIAVKCVVCMFLV